MQGTWESDGSETDSLSSWATTADGESYTITVSTSSGSPMNAAYKFQSNPSHYFYQVNVLEMPSSSSYLSIGVVLPQEFQRGYKNRGMFYNGNLTNCGAALKTSYGPRLKEGDTLILGYSEDDHAGLVRLEVYLNGSNLGTAFQVPKNGPSSFCPCVSIQGDIKVQAKILEVLPDPLPQSEEKHPLEGKWDLVEAYHDGQQFYPPPDTVDVNPCLVSLEKDNESGEILWNVVLHICNTIMIRKTIQPSGTNSCYSLQSHGGCRSTRMMPKPPYGQVESTMSASLENAWSQMEIVSSGATLIIKSLTGDVVAKCTKAQRSTEPACTSYQ
jgi:hypothetical protein